MKKIIILCFLLLSIYSLYGQDIPFKRVRTDSLSSRGDRIYITNKKGSEAYIRTSGDSLYFGDITGENRLVGANAMLKGDSIGTGAKYVTRNALIDSINIHTTSQARTAGDGSIGYLKYNGLTKAAGQLYGGTSNPSNTTRLNYDGYFYATLLAGTTISGAHTTGSISITDPTNTILTLTSERTNVALLKRSTTQSSNTTDALLKMQRSQNLSGYNDLQNIISIIDNPTGTGIVGGILSATIGTTERISLNPRALNYLYIIDSHRKLKDTSTIFAIKDSGSIRVSVKGNGDIASTGDVTYKFRHAVGGADSINYSVGGIQNAWYKINTGAIIIRDTVGMTIAGDSIKCQKTGDYNLSLGISATTSNANDQLRIKVYVNNAPISPSMRRFMINSNGNAGSNTHTMTWYIKGLAANAWVSFHIQNQTASRAITITDIGYRFEKVPE